jgi:hypothetical protein
MRMRPCLFPPLGRPLVAAAAALTFALAVALVPGPGRARAQTSTFPPLTLTLEQRIVNNDGSVRYQPFNDMDRLTFFNFANCVCGSLFSAGMQFQTGSPGASNDTVEVWTGTQCDMGTDPNARLSRCTKADAFSVQALASNTAVHRELHANQLMAAGNVGTCYSDRAGTNNIFALIDEQGAGTTFQLDQTVQVPFDLQPPSPVANPSSVGVENAVKVQWDAISGSTTDIRGYQVLCARQDGSPVFAQRTNDPVYIRPADVAGCNPSATGVPDAGPTTADAGAVVDPTSFEGLDPRFICSGEIGATGNEARIDVGGADPALGPNEAIRTIVVTIDNARNYASVAAGSASPSPVRDAWEVYKDDGGQADGGFCFVATAAYGNYDHPYVRILRHFRDHTLARTATGRAFIRWYYRHSPPWAAALRRHPWARVAAQVALFPLVLGAWVWDATTLGEKLLALALVIGWLAWRRRRRRSAAAAAPAPRVRRLAAAAGALLLVGALPRVASAQVMLDDETLSQPVEHGLPRSNWAFELKIGPYYPDVDGEAALNGATPFHDMFGDGSMILPQLELDRFLAYPLGELGIGLSIGYSSNSAQSFTEDASGHATTMRSGDETTFHLIPIALLAVYRFTVISDRSVVPLVPYAKLGLSYYIWWNTRGDGSVSVYDPTGQEGRGATLGWQGSLGLAFRADRLDPDAARAAENELGVEHISFFAEVTYAQVNGLLSSNKLHLGDFTWNAGINFEF